MPYILQTKRKELSDCLQSLKDELSPKQKTGFGTSLDTVKPGVLNYLITELLLHKLTLETPDDKLPTYTQLNEIIGILECCKLEIYRRLGKLIEENAINKNADLDSYSMITLTNKK